MAPSFEARLQAARPLFGEIQRALQDCLQRSAIRLQLPDEREPSRSEVRVDPVRSQRMLLQRMAQRPGRFARQHADQR